MSAEAEQFSETNVPGAEKHHRANETNSAVQDLPAGEDLRLSPALRMRENSLSPRPFLFSSRRAWIVLDFVLALTVGAFTHFLYGDGPSTLGSSYRYAASGLPFAVFVLLLAALSGLYQKNANSSAFIQLLRILSAVVSAGLGLHGLRLLWGIGTLPFHLIVVRSVLAGAAMFLSRALWRRHRDRLYRLDIALRNFLLVGTGEISRDVCLYLTSLRYSGYRFKGFVSLCEPGERVAVDEDEIAGEIDNVIEIARSRFIDEIIFSRRPSTPGVLSQVIRQARTMGISVRLIPSLTETLVDRTDVQYIGDLPTIDVFQARRRPLALLAKRAIDVTLASIAMIVLLPVLAAIAIAVKVQSPGPLLYASKRVGHKGRVFTCYKFRTMIDRAEALQEQLAHMNERRRVLFKISNDPRVTALGAFLRKYSLDELPQLWNVIRGDMSLVGPRPSLGSEVAQYEAQHLRRLDAVPGITGLWQVEGRQDPSFEKYISLDSQYVNHWSLQMDLRIMLRTIAAVIRGTGS
ncbi:MAG: sugar transferase [Terracidiphilus sp.]